MPVWPSALTVGVPPGLTLVEQASLDRSVDPLRVLARRSAGSYSATRRRLVVVTIGVDAHKSSLAVALVDELGRELAHEQFGNDARGHRALYRWVSPAYPGGAAVRGREHRLG